MATRLITLTTDFGTRDSYVAAVKGVLTSRAPGIAVIDLTHDLPPFDPPAAAYFLLGAIPYFPPKTVHLVVVDPGVGGPRRGIAVACGDQFLVGPDNGVFGYVLAERGWSEAARLDGGTYARQPVSPTFHGRDLFAPATAVLAGGGLVAALGPAIADPSVTPIPPTTREAGVLVGIVWHIDRFGNCITNIRAGQLPDTIGDAFRVMAAGRQIQSFVRTYAVAPRGTPVALMSSGGFVEIAVVEGRADEALGLALGAEVRLEPVIEGAMDDPR